MSVSPSRCVPAFPASRQRPPADAAGGGQRRIVRRMPASGKHRGQPAPWRTLFVCVLGLCLCDCALASFLPAPISEGIFAGNLLSKQRLGVASRQARPGGTGVEADFEPFLSAGPSYVPLMNGRTEPYKSIWTIALRKDRPKIGEYDFSYQCDAPLVLEGSGGIGDRGEGDCEIAIDPISEEHAEAQGLAEFAVHVATVTCIAHRFPGACICQLVGSRSGGSASAPLSSPKFRTVITGAAFYDLGGLTADGAVSKETRIFSGSAPATPFSSPVDTREDMWTLFFGVRLVPPSGELVRGPDAVSMLNSAKVTTRGTNNIFLYDSLTCRPGNFSLAGGTPKPGVFVLKPPESCGFGAVLDPDGGDIRAGFRIRPYIVGTKSVVLNWVDFGRDVVFVPYEQSVSITMAGDVEQPPVVMEMSGEGAKGELSSAPCKDSEETIRVRMYNVDGAKKSVVRLVNQTSDEPKEWGESKGFSAFDPSTSTWTSVFRNSGGVGRNVMYELVVSLENGVEKKAVFLRSANAPETLNFSEPLQIARVVPQVVQFAGGIVTLEGNFPGFRVKNGDGVGLNGTRLSLSSVVSSNLTHIELKVPAVQDNGKIVLQAMQVIVCGAPSNEVILKYGNPPIASIWSLNVGRKDVNASLETMPSYTVPRTGKGILFVAESRTSNIGLQYKWSLADINREEIDLGKTTDVLNLSTFMLYSDAIQSQEKSIILSVYMENSSGNDSASVVLDFAEGGSTLLTTVVYPVARIERMGEESSLIVHGSAQLFGPDFLTEEDRIKFEWSYNGVSSLQEGVKGNDSVAEPIQPAVTSVTRLGQEFNLAAGDLVPGVSKLSLTATTATGLSTSSFAEIDTQNLSADIVAVINNGLNMTTVDSALPLLLSSRGSFDAHVFSPHDYRLEIEWVRCSKSAKNTPDAKWEDCMNVLGGNNRDLKSSEVELSSGELRKLLPEDANEAYVTIGLQVARKGRSAISMATFRIMKAVKGKALPQIAGVRFEDSKGRPLDPSRIDHLTEVTLHPLVIDKKNSQWNFVLRDLSQNKLVDLEDVLREGPGLFSPENKFDKRPIVIAAGKLIPNTQYALGLTVHNKERNVYAQAEMPFSTRPIPLFSCTGPANVNSVGIPYETEYVISAETSFSSTDLRYCFSIVSRTSGSRYEVGLGCSTVRVARFSWPLSGTYDIVCDLRTSSGALISTVQISDGDGIRIAQRKNISSAEAAVAKVSERVQMYELTGNHEGIYQVAATLHDVLNPFLVNSKPQNQDGNNSIMAPDANTSVASKPDQRSSVIDLVGTLCAAVRKIGIRTVYTASSIVSTIEVASSVFRLPPALFDGEALLDCVYSVSLGVEATEGQRIGPVTDKRLLNSIANVANMSVTTAAHLSGPGTSRNRLTGSIPASEGSVGMENYLFSLFLNKVPLLLAQISLQQAVCGFGTAVDTAVDKGSSGQVPIRMFLSVMCPESGSSRYELGASHDEGKANIEVDVCPELVSFSDNARVPLAIIHTNPEQFCEATSVGDLHTLLTAPLELSFPRMALTGEARIPSDCISVRVPHVDYVQCNYTQRSGTVPLLEEVKESGRKHIDPVSSNSTGANSKTLRKLGRWSFPVHQILLDSVSQNDELNRVGGRIDGGLTFKSARSGNTTANSDLKLTSSGTNVLYGTKSVVFRTRTPGQFIAGFRRDPGDPVAGFTQENILFFVCALGGGVVVLIAIFVVSRGYCIAGVPQRRLAESIFVERDMFARAELDDIDVAKAQIAYAKTQQIYSDNDESPFAPSAPPLRDL